MDFQLYRNFEIICLVTINNQRHQTCTYTWSRVQISITKFGVSSITRNTLLITLYKCYLKSDDVFFFLFNEERVEFLELILQQVKKINLLIRHAFPIGESPTFLGPGCFIGNNRRVDELQTFFKFLVRQKLVTPFRQCSLYLVAQALTELHAYIVVVLHKNVRRNRELYTKTG